MAQAFKPWLSFADQIKLLESRGMVFSDTQQAEFELARIGYYRLSGYFYPFRVLPLPQSKFPKRQDNFVAGTEFNHVIELYNFDNAIKLLALEAVQHIEIAMRTHIAYTLGKHHPIAHLMSDVFQDTFEHEDWLSRYYGVVARELRTDQKNKKYKGFVLHNKEQYGSLPIWCACELWDFGLMSKLYENMKSVDKQAIEHQFKLFNGELFSHLKAFNFVRNVAAHHGRLWNRHIIGIPSIQYLIDAQNSQWQSLLPYSDHVFTVFCLMQRMLKVIDSHNDWGQRFQAVLNTFPIHNAANNEVNLNHMGMGGLSLVDLANWQLWQ